jgi:hypothetical protein
MPCRRRFGIPVVSNEIDRRERSSRRDRDWRSDVRTTISGGIAIDWQSLVIAVRGYPWVSVIITQTASPNLDHEVDIILSPNSHQESAGPVIAAVVGSDCHYNAGFIDPTSECHNIRAFCVTRTKHLDRIE